jgi:hypothetical protein
MHKGFLDLLSQAPHIENMTENMSIANLSKIVCATTLVTTLSWFWCLYFSVSLLCLAQDDFFFCFSYNRLIILFVF